MNWHLGVTLPTHNSPNNSIAKHSLSSQQSMEPIKPNQKWGEDGM